MFRNDSDDEIKALSTVPSTLGSTVILSNDNSGALRQIRLTLSSLALTVTDALAYASVKIATLPEGFVTLLGAVATGLTFTTTSVIADTLNGSKTVQWSIGTAAASATTLSGTMINIVPGIDRQAPTFTSSGTINVASTAVNASLFDTDLFDGSGTAIPIYLNLAVFTGTDIDADATLTISGKIVITFIMAGDA